MANVPFTCTSRSVLAPVQLAVGGIQAIELIVLMPDESGGETEMMILPAPMASSLPVYWPAGGGY